MNEKKSKNIIIIALCITLIFMGVGFSLLTQTLTVNTTATVSGTWNVHFKSFADSTSSTAPNQGVDTTPQSPGYLNGTSTTATVTFDMFKPGDTVQYTAVIKNYGNIDAVFTGFTSTLNNDTYISRTVTYGGTTVAATEGAVTAPSSATLAADNNTDSDEVTVVITYTYNNVNELPTPNAKSDSNLDANDVYRVTDTLTFGFTQSTAS